MRDAVAPAPTLAIDAADEHHEAVAPDAPNQQNTEREHRLTLAALRAHPAFALTPQDLKTVVRCARRLVLPRYREAYREGAPSHHFFVLLAGEMKRKTAATGEETFMNVTDRKMAGVCFGLEALIVSSVGVDESDDAQPRRANTVTALNDCTVLQFALSDVRKAISVSSTKRLLEAAFSNYVRTELEHTPVFDTLDTSAMVELAGLFDIEDHGTAGESVFDDGDEGDKLFILVKGEVAIVKNGKVLAVLSADHSTQQSGGRRMRPFFGEMALLDGKPRMAGAKSRTPATLLVLKQKSFDRLFTTVPDFKQRLQAYKALRARESELLVSQTAFLRTQKEAKANSERVKQLLVDAVARSGTGRTSVPTSLQ